SVESMTSLMRKMIKWFPLSSPPIGKLFTVCAHFEQPGGRKCAFNILSHAERGRITWDHCRHCRRLLCRPWHRGERHQSSDTVDAVLEGDVDDEGKLRSLRKGRQIAEPDEPCKGGDGGPLYDRRFHGAWRHSW